MKICSSSFKIKMLRSGIVLVPLMETTDIIPTYMEYTMNAGFVSPPVEVNTECKLSWENSNT